MAKKTASIKKAITKKKTEKKADKEAQKKPQESTRRRGMNLYSNLAYKRRVKADQRARKKAEELAELPKNPFLRFLARLRPDRFFKWWFSRDNQIRLLKIFVAFILIIIIAIGGLFLYYKKDLAEINPEELANAMAKCFGKIKVVAITVSWLMVAIFRLTCARQPSPSRIRTSTATWVSISGHLFVPHS